MIDVMGYILFAMTDGEKNKKYILHDEGDSKHRKCALAGLEQCCMKA